MHDKRLYLENFIQKEILNKINILIKTSENNKPKVETKVFISSKKQSISKEVETKKKM